MGRLCASTAVCEWPGNSGSDPGAGVGVSSPSGAFVKGRRMLGRRLLAAAAMVAAGVVAGPAPAQFSNNLAPLPDQQELGRYGVGRQWYVQVPLLTREKVVNLL